MNKETDEKVKEFKTDAETAAYLRSTFAKYLAEADDKFIIRLYGFSRLVMNETDGIVEAIRLFKMGTWVKKIMQSGIVYALMDMTKAAGPIGVMIKEMKLHKATEEEDDESETIH